MKKWIYSISLIAGLMLASCNQRGYQASENGVTVRIKKSGNQPAQLVRVQVISDGNFRVSAIPSGAFTDPESLSVVQKDSVFRVTIHQSQHRAGIPGGSGAGSFGAGIERI